MDVLDADGNCIKAWGNKTVDTFNRDGAATDDIAEADISFNKIFGKEDCPGGLTDREQCCTVVSDRISYTLE